ncbi:velvet factor-domain-containing protein [Lipomyces orientalis]|uniref:Velvet factor-domain-containing protein n=1 Tax=Lipomyces orientalis TaxID=1233043 RepID=A0ACC3TN08_9ASCO
MTSAAAPGSSATAEYHVGPDHVKSEISPSSPDNVSSRPVSASLASTAYDRSQFSPILSTNTQLASSRRLLASRNSNSGTMASMQVQIATPHSCTFKLEVAQHPVQARASGWGSRSDTRRPVDPPPVVNLYVYLDGVDVTSCCKNTFILQATLHSAHPVAPSLTSPTTPTTPPQTSNLIGTTITSLNFMKQPPPGRAYFLFPDLSVRQEGSYRLVFSVFEICEDVGAIWRAEAVSDVLTVYSPKKFPGLDVSSALTREIASQGGKVRIRREARLRGRRPSSGVTAVSFGSLPSRPVTADSKGDRRPPLGSESVMSRELLSDEHLIADGKRKLVDPSRTVESPMISPLSAPTQQQPQHEYSYQSATYTPYTSTSTTAMSSTATYYPYHTPSAYNIFPPPMATQQTYLPPPPPPPSSSTWAVPRNFSQPQVLLPQVSQTQGQLPQYAYGSTPQYTMASTIDQTTGQPRYAYVDGMILPLQQRPPNEFSSSSLPSSSSGSVSSSTSSGSRAGASQHPSISWATTSTSAQQLPMSMIPGQQVAGVPMMQQMPPVVSMPMQVSVGSQMTMVQQQPLHPPPHPLQQQQQHQQQQQQPAQPVPHPQTGQLGLNIGSVSGPYLYDEGFEE